MNSSLKIARFAGQFARFTGTVALLAGCSSAKTGRAVVPEQTLVIRVYDAAHTPDAVIHSATMEAGRLFRAAGIQITWEFGVTESPEDRGTDMTAPPFRQPDQRPYLVIRLMRGAPAAVFPGALGYSLPFARRGAHVQIFYDRIEALARSINTAGDVILGHAMAHELGHVLLRSTEHASGGLMQARWTPASWRLASSGLLVFNQADRKRIRASVAAQ